MSSVEPMIIQSLLEEIERLETELKGTAHMESARINQNRIAEVRTAIVSGSDFDPNRWSELSADKQRHLLDRITMIRDGLLAKNGVEDAKHSNYLLQRDGESKQSFIWLAILGFVFAATLLSLIR